MFEGVFQPLHLLVIGGIALLVFGPQNSRTLAKESERASVALSQL